MELRLPLEVFLGRQATGGAEICKVEQFLKRRQERSVAPPQTSGRLTAGDNGVEVRDQKSDSLIVSIPRHSLESLSYVPR